MWVPKRTAALFHSDAQQRALFSCVGVSVALHALLLFAFPGLRPGAHPDGPKVLTAKFTPRTEPAEAMPSAHVPWKPSEKRHEARPQMPLPALAPPVVPKVAEPTFVPAPGPPSAAQALQSEATRASEISSTEAAAKPLVEGFDAGLLDAYRLALIDAAKRYRRYPVQAMERGWQGRVEIRIAIGADGMIKRTHVKTSSNYQILDEQALDMVKRSKPLIQIPSALRGREFSVDIPVIFELQTG
jgi:protein TonB